MNALHSEKLKNARNAELLFQPAPDHADSRQGSSCKDCAESVRQQT